MNNRSEEGGLTIREARLEDSSALVVMCRNCFRRSPEWYAPKWVVAKWWRGLIKDTACHVEVIEHADVVVGYLVTTRSYLAWRRRLSVGPNRKWIKFMVMLTRPVIFKSLIKKKLRAKLAAASSSGSELGGPKLARVSSDSVISGRSGLYLAIMAIVPEARGLGGGKRIVERFVDLGVSGDAEVLWLHVDPRNKVAQALYSKYGFELNGVDGSSLLMSRGR